MTAALKTTQNAGKLMSELEAHAKKAADEIRSYLKNIDLEVYKNFLDVMYHYTKESEKHLKKAASMATNEELKNHFNHMAKEERGHYLVAQEDLRALGREVSPQECKEVTKFNADWNNLAEKGVYGYLGASYVFENVAKYLQQESIDLLKRLNLKKTQQRWVMVHLEADIEHGEEEARMCEKYGAENAEAVLYGADTMCKSWVNVFIAATRPAAT